MKKVMLIDGNSMMFKAFFATFYTGAWMKTKEGFPTNALYGMANMVYKLVNDRNPDYLLIAFDTGKKTKRHMDYPEYKAGRTKAPDELFQQIPKVYEMIDKMGIFRYSQDGIEADDIIGTLAKSASDHGLAVEVYTSDKDLLQLVNKNTVVHLTKKGISVLDSHDSTNFVEKNEIDPLQVMDLKGLMGDASDNIPGVKGVGAKTAIKLLKEYKTVEGVYENIENIKGALKTKLENDKDNAFMSKELATIYIDCELPFTTSEMKFDSINKADFKSFCEEFEMNSIARKL